MAGQPVLETKRECPVGTPSFGLSARSAAWGRGARPRPACGRGASHLPLRPAGRYPAHPGRRRGAARPARPLRVRSGTCGGQGRACGASRSSWPPAVARGHPSAMQGQAPTGRADGPALHCSSPAPVAASVLRGGPAPTMWGLWGRPPLRPGRRRSGQPCQPGHACGAGRAARLCLRTRRPA